MYTLFVAWFVEINYSGFQDFTFMFITSRYIYYVFLIKKKGLRHDSNGKCKLLLLYRSYNIFHAFANKYVTHGIFAH